LFPHNKLQYLLLLIVVTLGLFVGLPLLHAKKTKFSPLDHVHQWICYYGSEISAAFLKKTQLIIADPDIIFPEIFPSEALPLFVGYVSVGEAEKYRWYWPLIKDKPWVLEENPNWSGNHWVDVRSEEWQELILDHMIPRLLNRGYQGVFLDTLDTGEYLEGKDPEKWKGSQKALVKLVKNIRRRYPQMIIIPNNGLSLLPSIERHVDGVVIEDLYTRYNFETKTCDRTPPSVTEDKETILDYFMRRMNKPVFVIHYAQERDQALADDAIRRSREKGYRSYTTTVDLKSIGKLAP